MGTRTKTVRTPVAVSLLASFLVVGVLACIGGSWDPGPDQADTPDWPGWVGVALGVGLIARASVVGVAVRGSTLLIRNWFRTRRIDLHDVAGIGLAHYDGLLYRGGGGSERIFTLAVEPRHGKAMRAWGILGRRTTVQRRAERLRAWLAPRREDSDADTL